MNDTFSEQKEKLVAINQEISLLRQQISYLLRNEKPLGLLDLDVLMNRTHTVYDLLCAINLGENADDEDLDIDPDVLAGLFGGLTEDEIPETSETTEEVTPEENKEVDEAPEPETVVEEERVEEEPEPEQVAEEPMGVVEVPEPETIEEPEMEIMAEPGLVEEEAKQENPDSDKYGFFFRFEEQPDEEPEPVEEEETPAEPVIEHHDEPVLTEDGKLVHFVEEVPVEEIPARDLVDGDSLVRDNPFDMPRMEDGNDEPDFEMAPETLGESLMHEDYTLAAKLQQAPGRDLKSVIGINDKFLFVNELFGGSMEKYNKAIENLNDLKTLNGAMIYLNELKIELQWNSSNEAYQKLADLVARKFD